LIRGRRCLSRPPVQLVSTNVGSLQHVDELVRQYLSGADMHELAELWDLHRTTVAGHLRRANVPLRRQGLSDEQLAEAIRLYGEGWSCQRMAERFGCATETIRQCLKAADVVLRKPWERV